MPIYQYRCSACDQLHEQKEGFDAPSEHQCPHCGALARRLFHPPAILFKGPGFYSTDNRPASSSSDGHNGAEGKPAEPGGSGAKESTTPTTSSPEK